MNHRVGRSGVGAMASLSPNVFDIAVPCVGPGDGFEIGAERVYLRNLTGA